ncbi:MAG: COX15/CtaA family protein [Gammaproteobacteria bacterium]|nr:COX15/CtaA family protein [Gammaproteobacteria bacterium]MDH4310232.1 COX15/CtaA family protein [Gammaproteobacteria bacterium]MDH5273972.1 COX15/CtaA family protein [Gammaproteobacteria bacterium]
MNTKKRLTTFRKLCLFGAILAFCVIVLGAYVRLSHAGLGCPDWPGCYGHLTAGQAAENQHAVNAEYPDRPVEYAKALKEMLHRYLAATLGFVILVIGALAWRNRQDSTQPVRLPLAVVGLVVLQGLLGMWTVTLLLKPAIVSAHLAGGLTTMALLWWMSLQTTRRSRPQSEDSLRRWAVIGMVALVAQILLGGWVSANYSAMACPDFPTCQRSFWPTMDFRDAFVLWRGLGIDYEGGVLDHPARVAIHFTHRIGAIVTALVLGFVAWKAMRTGQSLGVRTAGLALAAALVTQLLVGPLMVIRTFPLPLATAHNAIAALLVLAMVALLRFLFPPRGSGSY